MSGDKKNVVTIDYPSVEDIYDTNRSAQAEKNLTDIKKNKIFSLKMRCGRIIRMVQTTARCMCILKQAENAIVNIRFLWMMQIYRIYQNSPYRQSRQCIDGT